MFLNVFGLYLSFVQVLEFSSRSRKPKLQQSILLLLITKVHYKLLEFFSTQHQLFESPKKILLIILEDAVL